MIRRDCENPCLPWCCAALQVILTEDFDRGLMVLRRLMRWEMIDLTYSKMMETKKGVVRWDNIPLVDVPSFDSLPQWVSAACPSL